MGGWGGGGRGLQAQLTEKKHSDNVFLGISLLQFYRGTGGNVVRGDQKLCKRSPKESIQV